MVDNKLVQIRELVFAVNYKLSSDALPGRVSVRLNDVYVLGKK
jgi:hypothetical protein